MTSVTPERTELEWTYQPSDLFEAPYRHADSEYDVVIEGGKAIVTLRAPQDPVTPDLEERIKTYLTSAFRVRQLLVHRKYKLEGPQMYQYAAGRHKVAIRVGTGALVLTGHAPDVVIRDAAGNIVRDTKAERIADHTAILDSVAPKAAHSPPLSSLLASYSRSVFDAPNELVHLYEIRDALCQHFGNEHTARQQLGISRVEWQRLGVLANAEPLEQGRHRGKHPVGRRVASATELEEARGIVKGWICAFATLV